MDRQGYEAVRQVLDGEGFTSFDVQPEPAEGEDVRYVGVYCGYEVRDDVFIDNLRPDQVLNALYEAGMMDAANYRGSGPRFIRAGISSEPRTRRHLISLEDLNAP